MGYGSTKRREIRMEAETNTRPPSDRHYLRFHAPTFIWRRYSARTRSA